MTNKDLGRLPWSPRDVRDRVRVEHRVDRVLMGHAVPIGALRENDSRAQSIPGKVGNYFWWLRLKRLRGSVASAEQDAGDQHFPCDSVPQVNGNFADVVVDELPYTVNLLRTG